MNICIIMTAPPCYEDELLSLVTQLNSIYDDNVKRLKELDTLLQRPLFSKNKQRVKDIKAIIAHNDMLMENIAVRLQILKTPCNVVGLGTSIN
jgi:hypothetical protein